MKKISLNGEWSLYFYDREKMSIMDPDVLKVSDIQKVTAIVPGDTYLDLSRAGILPADLFKGMNIRETELYENYDWWYEKEFDFEGEIPEKITLDFGGVDCLAEYYLNGELFGTSENMFMAQSFDVTDYLKPGKNLLQIKLSSVINAAYNGSYDNAFYESAAFWGHCLDASNIRKPPHSYGWDIMCRCVTYGLWKDVELVVHDRYEFVQTYVVTEELNRDKNYAEMRLMYELSMPIKHRDDNCEIEISGSCGDSKFYAKKWSCYKTGDVTFGIGNAKLWWPHGYGEPNLYNAKIRYLVNGECVAEKDVSFGVRTARLDMTEITDGKNGRFCFVVNGVDILALGTNWVPLDAFHSRDIERVDKAMEMAHDLECNIIRCWGGNVYESDRFYELCDKYGIMVWQDFGMACAHYPMTSDFCERIRAEVKWVVQTRRQHPCIVLWAGDNEVDQMLNHHKLGIDPQTNKVTREYIPDEIRRHDCARSYIPSSPFVPTSLFKTRDDLRFAPENHIWGPRDYFKSKFYTTNNAHFISECGYHGCPGRKSVEKFIDADSVWKYPNEQWILHSSEQHGRPDRCMLMEKQVRQFFGMVPDDLDNFAIASQISQAEADKFFIERMRCGKPTKSGVIWWNLVDGWPEFSDAIVDYYYEKKLAYDYIKVSQKPVCLMFDEIDNWGITLVADNNTLSTVSGTYEVLDGETDEVLAKGGFRISPNANTRLCKLNFMYSEKKLFLIKWKTENGEEGQNHYLAGLPPFDFEKVKNMIPKITGKN